MNSKLVFLSNFLKKPREVASITPSSRHVVKHILKNIDFNRADCIAEYGPGIGNTTKALLGMMKLDAKLICFELNPKFCSFLNKNSRDERLIVVNDSAEKLDFYLKKFKISNIDYAVSGIPFSLIKPKNKKEIIKKTKDSLRRGGKFIVYQNSQHAKKYLAIYFNRILRDFEVRNFPPTHIFACEKI